MIFIGVKEHEFFIVLIELWLIENVVLVPGVYQSDSYIYIYIYIFHFIFFPVRVYYKILNKVP